MEKTISLQSYDMIKKESAIRFGVHIRLQWNLTTTAGVDNGLFILQ